MLETGCPKSNLPTIVGSGKISLIREFYDLGETIEVKCDEGFEIDGTSKSSCGKDSTFSPKTLTCKRKGKNQN